MKNPRSRRTTPGVERLSLQLRDNYRMQADTALKFAEQVWWRWDMRKQRLYLRCPGECILGYGPEHYAESESFWWERIHPHDVEAVRESLKACQEGTESLWTCEHRILDAGDEWAWVEQHGFVLHRDRQGRPREMVGIMRKTSERHQLLELFMSSDALIGAFAELAPLAFWLRDPDGRILLASSESRQQFGRVRGDPFAAGLAEERELESWRDLNHQAIAGKRATGEITLHTREGRDRTFACHCIPVKELSEPYAVLEIFLPECDGEAGAVN